MSSLAVGLLETETVIKAPLKTGLYEKNDDYKEFETEVLYARIDELEKKKDAYKMKLQQIKRIVQTNYESPIKLRDAIVKVLTKSSKKKTVSDLEIKNAISNIVIVD